MDNTGVWKMTGRRYVLQPGKCFAAFAGCQPDGTGSGPFDWPAVREKRPLAAEDDCPGGFDAVGGKLRWDGSAGKPTWNRAGF